ncbi:MAG: hypothetical protein WD049_02270 [Candidatus Paceibacterota bacterium]
MADLTSMDRAEASLVEGQKLLIAAEETLEYHNGHFAYTVITAPFAPATWPHFPDRGQN